MTFAVQQRETRDIWLRPAQHKKGWMQKRTAQHMSDALLFLLLEGIDVMDGILFQILKRVKRVRRVT